MKTFTTLLKVVAASTLALALFIGCESTDGGGNVQGSAYYGTSSYDSWYYGSGDYPPDVIVTPPDRPDSQPHPEHPIATPPMSTPRPTPMPSIPSTPRPMPRAGGGRR
jgi:hypothetical protein